MSKPEGKLEGRLENKLEDRLESRQEGKLENMSAGMPECRPEVEQYVCRVPMCEDHLLLLNRARPPPTGLSPRANALFSGTEDSALTWQSESDEKTQCFR